MAKTPDQKPEQMRFRDVTCSIEVSHNDKRKFLVEALDDALAECVQKAARYQTKAAFAVKVEVLVTGDKVAITADLVAKLPSPGATSISAYVDAAGRLLADDPRQENLFQIAPPAAPAEGEPK